MPTFTTVDASWDTGVTLDAAELRRVDSAMFLGDGTNNGVRGGIVYHGPTSLAVTVNGSDQVTVQAGAFVVPAATGLGVYRGALSAALGPTAGTALTARNATNPRIDLVVIQMTGTNATVKTIDGTPAASPSAPALPAQHIELSRLNVPAVGGGPVTVDSTWRTFATGLGGTLPVATLNRLPGSGNITGQRAIALDTGVEHTWNGTAWVVNGVTTAFAPTLTATTTNPTMGTGAVNAGRWVSRDGWIQYQYRIAFGTGMAAGSGTYLIQLPVAPSTAWANRLVGTGAVYDISTNSMMPVTLRVNGTTSVLVMQFGATYGGTVASVGHNNTFVWAASDELHGTVVYEAA